MATRGQLGGLAPATADICLLLDAAGYDTILIETVGVGQDEVDIARLADVTAVVLVPGMGDEVQSIKAGLMEIGDVYILNKADHPGIDKLEQDVRSGLHPPRTTVRCVATEGVGVEQALGAMRRFHESEKGQSKLVQNWKFRLKEMFRERVSLRLTPEELDRAAGQVAARETDPFTVVNDWLRRH